MQLGKGGLSANPTLFNGSKFRLAGVIVRSGYDLKSNNTHFIQPKPTANLTLTLKVGLSDYKNCTVTNLSYLAPLFSEYGLKMSQDSQLCMADVIGHSCLLLSSDGYFVIQLRSQTVGEAAGMWHFPGGHPEPEDVGIHTNDDLFQSGQDVIVNEIYNSLLKELKEELNIPLDNLSEPMLLSIIRDKGSYYKPEFNFITHANLTAAQIAALYYAEDFNDDESDDIAFWSINNINDMKASEYIALSRFKDKIRVEESVDMKKMAMSSRILVRNIGRMCEINPILFVPK